MSWVSRRCITRTYMGIRPGLGPLAAEQTSQILRDLRSPPGYLLYVGTIEPRKNILALLQAYCALPEEICALAGPYCWSAAGAGVRRPWPTFCTARPGTVESSIAAT